MSVNQTKSDGQQTAFLSEIRTRERKSEAQKIAFKSSLLADGNVNFLMRKPLSSVQEAEK